MASAQLKGVRILADMTDTQLDELQRYGKITQLAPGQAVIGQGDESDAMYLVLEGKVGAYVTDPQGNETHLRTIESGGYFGEIGLLVAGKRTASLRTLSTCTVFRID